MAYKIRKTRTGKTSTRTSTYNTSTGRTRVSHSVRPTKSLKITRSTNKNGTIKTTTTQNINGWITRKTSTQGTGIVKSKRLPKPKVRKLKPSAGISWFGGGRKRRSATREFDPDWDGEEDNRGFFRLNFDGIMFTIRTILILIFIGIALYLFGQWL